MLWLEKYCIKYNIKKIGWGGFDAHEENPPNSHSNVMTWCIFANMRQIQ